MISVLTLTYQRYHLLEEAIQSFLLQNFNKAEMVIINDSPDVEYVFNHPQIKILNLKERFPSIGKKLEWGYKQCINDYIYRLDDDDLLSPEALQSAYEDINNNPGYEIYRSKNHYFFCENKFQNLSSNINNGNIYTREYLNNIPFPELSGNEDAFITYNFNAKIYESSKLPTMIYRWGMNTYHISGMGINPNNIILSNTDKLINKEYGIITLVPKFKEDYYSQIA